MTVKVPVADYRTLRAYAQNKFTTPTTVVKNLIHTLCEGERNLATHKK
jgi:hypothetical protein